MKDKMHRTINQTVARRMLTVRNVSQENWETIGRNEQAAGTMKAGENLI